MKQKKRVLRLQRRIEGYELMLKNLRANDRRAYPISKPGSLKKS